MFISTRGRGLK